MQKLKEPLDENQKDAMKLSQICRRREEDNPSF
jgi:hypothetical protein